MEAYPGQKRPPYRAHLVGQPRSNGDMPPLPLFEEDATPARLAVQPAQSGFTRLSGEEYPRGFSGRLADAVEFGQ